MNPANLRVWAVAAGSVLLASAWHTSRTNEVMTQTAGNLLASMKPEQRAKAVFRFEDEERFNWHFIPRPRKGVPLREMSPEQKQLAHALLSAGLSREGYIKATTVMSLDDVLRILEADNTGRRDAEGYYFSVFGTPAAGGKWGYRVEGHHLSLNFSLVNGRLAGGPTFYGANPAEVRSGPRQGLRTLAREEDLARDLLGSLRPDQRTAAIVSATAYKDILTEASRKAALQGQPSGLSASRMNDGQREKLRTLVLEYAENLAPELAAARAERMRKAGANLFFAWGGPTGRGQPHYYRVQAPDFLIEYDNTQNDANHIHSVWRDLDGDFGLDLLQAHYRAFPHGGEVARAR